MARRGARTRRPAHGRVGEGPYGSGLEFGGFADVGAPASGFGPRGKVGSVGESNAGLRVAECGVPPRDLAEGRVVDHHLDRQAVQVEAAVVLDVEMPGGPGGDGGGVRRQDRAVIGEAVAIWVAARMGSASIWTTLQLEESGRYFVDGKVVQTTSRVSRCSIAAPAAAVPSRPTPLIESCRRARDKAVPPAPLLRSGSSDLLVVRPGSTRTVNTLQRRWDSGTIGWLSM